jgi:hypothetical protein
MVVRLALPECLEGQCTKDAYLRWLLRKARAHVRRDRERYGHGSCYVAGYRRQIHEAVCSQGHLDYYTGLPLDWSLISRFDNDEAKAGKGKYLQRFSDLPTVDHTSDSEGQLRFVICSWRVNDAKSHLSEADFFVLCEQVLAHRANTRK